MLINKDDVTVIKAQEIGTGYLGAQYLMRYEPTGMLFSGVGDNLIEAKSNAWRMLRNELGVEYDTGARRFNLIRDEDVSGVSGEGLVAEGVVFSNGKAVLAWMTDKASVAVYDSVKDLIAIHGHDGKTRTEFVD